MAHGLTAVESVLSVHACWVILLAWLIGEEVLLECRFLLRLLNLTLKELLSLCNVLLVWLKGTASEALLISQLELLGEYTLDMLTLFSIIKDVLLITASLRG